MRRFLLLLSLLVFGFSLDLFSQEPIGNDSLTISLDEVSIIAHNEFVQSNLNGFLVTIAGNIETKGRETTDILKQIPMLTISGDILGMSGKSTVIVYIDDRIVRLEGSTLLYNAPQISDQWLR